MAMVQDTISNAGKQELEQLFAEKQKAIGNFAKDVAEREWELFEFNLFISSMGKDKLDEATNAVKKLRKLEEEGKMDLEQYEELSNDF